MTKSAPSYGRTMDVRLLATSDLHMQIASYNYVKDVPDTSASLAKVATLIERVRRQSQRDGRLCLLLDNGDTLQGGPMADFLADQPGRADNPMIASMNQLKYDCGGLGNHDCDFGLDYLNACLTQHTMPVVCSNIISDKLPSIRSQILLTRSATASDGTPVSLRVGVLSTLPDKTAAWNRHHLSRQATLARPLPILREKAAALKRDGADLVIVLAHMGLAMFDEGEDAQNQIADVAALAEVDAVIGGHTHLRFPGPDHAGIAHVDEMRGMVHGTPVVQPGPSGADVGQIDLRLSQELGSTAWSVTDTDVRLIPVTPETPENKTILEIVSDTHAATCAYLRKPAGKIAKPMHSYFALAQPNPVIALMAAAKDRVISAAVEGTSDADLPLLSVASAKLSGGFDGPENFIFLSSGAIELRHVAGLNPYANQVWAVRATGARMLDWLERSNVIFNTLRPDDPDQLLIDPRVPGFRYDCVYGLEYVIDPRRTPKFDTAGRRIKGSPGRVTEVTWRGKPLDRNQEFLVATTDHRVGGGGLYQPFLGDAVAVEGAAPLRSALVDYLKAPDCAAVRSARPWRFESDLERQAILLTAPEAADHLDELAAFTPKTCGVTDAGFLRVRLTL